ncbi:MAG: hypothetical protein JWP25_1751 [Bradyrhizobium sp.]|nr:hypothetical protein [Bradyrhizobium sp.]
MCDYSLHAIALRPAKVGEKLVSTKLAGTPTRGFAAEAELNVAVCPLPGTELAFEANVKYDPVWFWSKTSPFRVARFRKMDPNVPRRHHDALEFPDGTSILVTRLSKGQRAIVLQLPVAESVISRIARHSNGETSAAAE